MNEDTITNQPAVPEAGRPNFESGSQPQPWALGLTAEEEEALDRAKNDPDQKVFVGVRPLNKLGRFEVILLILNRCIGTGVFMSASVITQNTESLGLSIIYWMCGSIFALAGTYLYVELGLTIPRFTWKDGGDEAEICTFCNGGELNYLTYMMKRPKFFAVCVFGIPFFIIGNTAANSINFGQNVLLAAGFSKASYGSTLGLGIAATLFACILHGLSRTWGIRLNSFLGFSKALILFFLIIIGLATAGVNSNKTPSLTNDLSPPAAFRHVTPNSKPFKYAEAFLFVLFPFSGFHQANYVLAEIDRPKTTFKRSTFTAIFIVCLMFTLLNIAYTLVVPEHEQTGGVDIGSRFFEISTATLFGTSSHQAGRAFAGLKAVSSLGNIIVVTFTASRVKQEIAKENILPPFPSRLFWAKSYYISLRGLFRGQTIQPDNSTESTPIPALFLHWLFTTVLVIAALVGVRSSEHAARDAYFFVVSVYAYVLDVVFFAWVALGVLYLRISPGSLWYLISPANHWVSIIAALIFLTGTAFPLICMWIPDPAKKTLGQSDSTAWYTSQTVGVAVFAFSILYWVGFKYIVPHIGNHGGRELCSIRTPVFRKEKDSNTNQYYLVRTYEIVKTYWGNSDRSDVDQTLIEREKAMETEHSTGDLRLAERESAIPTVWEIR